MAGTLHRAIATTQEQNRLSEHAHWVQAVAFGPNGDVFATSGRDGTVRLWADQGQLIMTIEGQPGERADSVSFSPDGQTLAISLENTLKLVNLQGQELQHFPGHSDLVTEVSFSPDGQTLASSAFDGTVALWNRDGTLKFFLEAHSPHAFDVKFSPDGNLLATSGVDGMIKLWDRTGTLVKAWQGNPTSAVYRVAFSPDGQMLASAGGDGTVKLWTMAGELINTFTIDDDNILFGLEFSPDGYRLAIATGEYGTLRTSVKVWSIDGQELDSLEGHGSRITDVSFSADGQRIASTSFDGTVRLWQPDKHRLYQVIDAHADIVSSLRFAADGETLISSSYDHTLKRWQADGILANTLESHTAEVNAVEVVPQSDRLISVSDDATLKVWQAADELQSTLEEHTAPIKGLTVSPDGEFWASADEDGQLKLWSNAGEVLQTRILEAGFANIIRFHPREPILAIAAGRETERTVLLWHWQEDTLTPLDSRGSFRVRDVQFSPDGELLATASWNGNLDFWDLAGRKQYSFFAGIEGPITTIDFSPNGQLIALTSGPSTLLFDRQGEFVQMFTAPEHFFPFSLRFSPDGTTLATGHRWGNILLWNLDLAALVQTGCEKSAAFLQSHPEVLGELPLCQTPERLQQSATVLVNQAIVQARQGNRDAALQTLQQALTWNPDLDLDPQAEVQKFVRQGEANRLLEEGDRLASEGDLAAATEKYQAAKVLDPLLTFEAGELAQQEALEAEVNRLITEGENLAETGDVEAAIAKFQTAKAQSPHLVIAPDSRARRVAGEAKIAEADAALDDDQFSSALTAFTQARQLYPDIPVQADLLHSLCRRGSLKGAAAEVLDICERAVTAAPARASTRDSRGLARALTGNFEGAIADFQFFVDNTENEADKQQRQQWIQQLQAGQNPFTHEVLKGLR
ncbi:MAG: hypothetical protein AAF609_26680 [Cyanobacteria bacterium P01_C01_bin.120]